MVTSTPDRDPGSERSELSRHLPGHTTPEGFENARGFTLKTGQFEFVFEETDSVREIA